MIKNQEYLSAKASYCLDLAKKLGASDSSVVVSNSISESVNFRNKKLDESNRSDNLVIGITTYIGKKKSSISSSNLLKEVSMVGNDMMLDPGIGTCGKAGQGVPVGVAQPSILINKMTVGGTKL